MRVSIIGVCHTSKPLLPCRVPNLWWKRERKVRCTGWLGPVPLGQVLLPVTTQKDASQCTKNSLPWCKHIKFSLELIYWPTCSLTLTLSTVTTLFWGKNKAKNMFNASDGVKTHPSINCKKKVLCPTTYTDYETDGLLHHIIYVVQKRFPLFTVNILLISRLINQHICCISFIYLFIYVCISLKNTSMALGCLHSYGRMEWGIFWILFFLCLHSI